MYLKLAWRNIWRNKTRSFITITSIMIAVLLSNVMESFQQGMWEKMLGTTMSFTGDIQIQGKDFWEEQTLDNGISQNYSLVKLIKSTKRVKAITPRIQTGALSAYKDLSRFVQIIGLSPQLEEEIIHFKTKLDKGELLTNDDNTIIVGKGLADYFELTVGDTLSLIGQGYHGESANGNFIVKGIIKYGSPEMNSRLVIMPFKLATQHFSTNGIITSYNVYVDKVTQSKKVSKVLATKVETSNYTVMSWQQMMPELEQAYIADTGGALIFLLVLYIIISFGIFGTILMMTTERMYEFGVMVSIGMKKTKMVIIIFLEVVMLAFLSVTMGSALSYPFMSFLANNPIPLTGDTAESILNYGFEAVIVGTTNPIIIQYNTIAVLIISLLVMIYPAIKILTLNPINAMKK